jgi:DNA-binding response OmpR family regulator
MKKVLIIEDEALIAKIYATRLKAEGIEVVIAEDGEIGLETALKDKPDLILLDLMIPKLSGSEVLAQLRKNPSTKSIPVLIHSNLSDDQEMRRVKNLGATEFLVKAKISAKELVTKITSYLQ